MWRRKLLEGPDDGFSTKLWKVFNVFKLGILQGVGSQVIMALTNHTQLSAGSLVKDLDYSNGKLTLI